MRCRRAVFGFDEEELGHAIYWVRFALEQVGLGVLVSVGVGLARGWLVS